MTHAPTRSRAAPPAATICCVDGSRRIDRKSNQVDRPARVVRLARGSVQSRRVKVLVVDEHGPSISVLCHVLSSFGHTCMGVASAAEALDSVVSFEPDVVVYEWN